MQKQWTRTQLLLGSVGMKHLREATVAVFGVGGVGSFTVEALARSGVGHLHLVDKDVVDVTNLNRQIHATSRTIGVPKVKVMRERVLEINPEAKVTVQQEFYLPAGAEKFFSMHYDYVVDAIDTVVSKIDLAVQCERRGVPLIASMGAGNKLDPTRFEVADIYKTSVDPLARVMRKKLKERGVKALEVVYSKEEPRKVESECAEEARTPGSIAFVPSVVGLIIAGVVIRRLAQVEAVTNCVN